MIDTESRKKWGDEAMMRGEEVADFLRVHLTSVRRGSRSGELKAYEAGNRGDVLAFIGVPSAAD